MYKVKKRKLITNMFRRKFKYMILDVQIVGSSFIVLLDIPNGVDEINNIYALNSDGTIKWRVQDPTRIPEFNMSKHEPYIHISFDNDIIKANTFMGLQFTINPEDGRIMSKKIVK